MDELFINGNFPGKEKRINEHPLTLRIEHPIGFNPVIRRKTLLVILTKYDYTDKLLSKKGIIPKN